MRSAFRVSNVDSIEDPSQVKAKVMALLRSRGHPVKRIVRVNSAGDSGCGAQEALFLDQQNQPLVALIRQESEHARVIVEITAGW